MEDCKKQTFSKSRIVQSTPKEANKSGTSGDITLKKLTNKTEQSDRLKVINIIQKLKVCIKRYHTKLLSM